MSKSAINTCWNCGSIELNIDDKFLREKVEESLTKSTKEWRSIAEMAYLVLKVVKDYEEGE